VLKQTAGPDSSIRVLYGLGADISWLFVNPTVRRISDVEVAPIVEIEKTGARFRMSSVSGDLATLDDLYRVEGKAELINGRIVHFMPTGFRPGRVGARIFRSLDDYAEAVGRGVALPDNVGFAIPELSSGRQSFSPDAAYYVGSPPSNPMRFLDGAPLFAVEVRSENDYGESAEAEMAAKREDYFEAGSAVVWDVDPVNELVRKYSRNSANRPTVFVRGQMADAEPAVPGWRIAVDQIFA
jgi:Uma2 family endonuclease